MRQLFLPARIVLLWLSALLAAPSSADDTVARAAFDIAAKKQGISLHLEHAAPKEQAGEKHAVLLLHGNFFPSSSTFGVELPGGSALDRLASAGLRVYALDLRGYGGSTRPPFMEKPIGPYVAFATTAEAQEDIASALAFIRKRDGVKRVSLVGWSWGAALVGEFATKHPGEVDKLVLYAPGWISKEPPAPQPPSGSYRVFDHDASRQRVLNGVPPERVEEIHPTAWFEQWWAANLRYDPWGSRQSPQVVRAPSGVTQAFTDFWSRGKAPWDPRRVRARTLVIVGEWDRNTPVQAARDVYERLERAEARELKILPEATHFAVLEKHRGRLLDELTQFLKQTSTITASR